MFRVFAAIVELKLFEGLYIALHLRLEYAPDFDVSHDLRFPFLYLLQILHPITHFLVCNIHM